MRREPVRLQPRPAAARWRAAAGIAIALPIAACAVPSPPSETPRALAESFQAQLDALREEHGLPGVTAAYALPDGRVEVFASGLADRELEVAATPLTRMMSGSTGKTLVAALAVALASEGRLGLDDPIRKWIGEESWFGRLPNGGSITLRMLLNHSSGLLDHVYTEEFGADLVAVLDDPDRRLMPSELVAYVLDRDPLFPPGEGYSYSDTNFILAGLILERAGGAPYEHQIQQRFLHPLGLRRTAPSHGRIHDGLAQGHLDPENPLGLATTTLDRGVFRFDPGTEWTGGGLVTNPGDLARWARALWGGEVLGAGGTAELLESAIPASAEGDRLGYGLGVSIWREDGGRAIGHGGWFPGYRTSVAYDPDHDLAVAIQTNTDAVDGAVVHQARAELARTVVAALP